MLKFFFLFLLSLTIYSQSNFYSYKMKKVIGIETVKAVEMLVDNFDFIDSLDIDTQKKNEVMRKTTFISILEDSYFLKKNSIFFELQAKPSAHNKEYKKRWENSFVYSLKNKAENESLLFYRSDTKLYLGYLSPDNQSNHDHYKKKFSLKRNKNSLSIIYKGKEETLFKKLPVKKTIRTILGKSVLYQKYDYVKFFGQEYSDIYEFYTTEWLQCGWGIHLVWFDKNFNMIRSESSCGVGVIKLSNKNKYVKALEDAKPNKGSCEDD